MAAGVGAKWVTGAAFHVPLQAVVVAEGCRPNLQDRFAASSVVPEFLRPFHPPVQFLDERLHQGRRRCLPSQEESVPPAAAVFAAMAGRSRHRCERRDLRPTRRRSSRSSCSDVGSKSRYRPTPQATSSRSNTKERGRWRRQLSSELPDCTIRRQSQVPCAEGKKSRLHLGQWKAGSPRAIFPSCVCSGRVLFFPASDSPDAPHVGQDAS